MLNKDDDFPSPHRNIMMEASLQDVHANKPPTYTLLKKNPSVAHCAFCQTPPRRLIPVVVTLRNRVGQSQRMIGMAVATTLKIPPWICRDWYLRGRRGRLGCLELPGLRLEAFACSIQHRFKSPLV